MTDTGMNIPETPETLQAQQDQLLRGLRIAQMFPSGTPELPTNGAARTQTPRGVFHYNPAKVDAGTIAKLSGAGRENELLGLGPYSKDDVSKSSGQPLAVVERQPDGTEVKASVGTSQTAPVQLAAFEQSKTPGNVVGIEPVDNVIAQRQRGGTVSGYASGGPVHVGSIKSHVAGRTDHIAMSVAPDSYVIPADIVSGLGEGNTESGNRILDRVFPPDAKPRLARGGGVPIMAAGGERVIPPEQVAKIGGGNIEHGHKILDKWIVSERKKLVKTLKKLPGPAKA
jgi:hypothetical protein